MKIQRMDHVGINVEDLEAAKAFFLELGLTVQWEADLGGELVERIIGLQNVSDRAVMLQTPDGRAAVELVKFYSPLDERGIQSSFANTLGLRHIAFLVEDVEAVVAKLKIKGGELMGEIVNYENVYKDCFVRGPEGIIVELAEKLNS
jgi:catechol 2,3-dioxygenase-like lactoylglutathione lyase family enzyme